MSQTEDDSWPVIEGEGKILEELRALSAKQEWDAVVSLCEKYRLLGGPVAIYGPYLFPVLVEQGKFDEAMKISEACADDVSTPVDQLKIIYLSGRTDKVIDWANAIIENPMWYGWKAVADALLMQAEVMRMNGDFQLAWQAIKRCYDISIEHKFSASFLESINASSRLIRSEAARPYDPNQSAALLYKPRLMGGPLFVGQVFD